MNNFSNLILKKSFVYCSLLLGISVIIFSYYLSLTLYSSFIIGKDEANFIIKSTMELISTQNTKDYLHTLFITHGQHVLLGMQLGNLLSYYLLGHIDFQFINLIGLSYIVIPAFLIAYRISTSSTNPYPSFFIIIAIIFPVILSPGHISCAINTACTGNHYLGLGMSIVSLYFYIPNNNHTDTSLARLGAAEFFALLAIMSSPAALILIPLFFIISFFLGHSRNKFIAVHLLSSLIILFLYFKISDMANFMEPSSTSLQISLQALVLFVFFVFNLIGSVFFWPNGLPLSIICASLGLAITIYGAFTIYKHKNILKRDYNLLFLASGFALFFGMAILIGIGRFYSYGSPRYIVYACFASVFLLLFILSTTKRSLTKIIPVIALICIVYYPVQYILNAPYIHRIQEEITACNKNWYENGSACGVMIKHKEATELLLEAEKRGVLKLPKINPRP